MGPIRITPTRVILVVALIGSIALLAYGVTVRDETTQIPLLAAGSAVLGLVVTSFAISGAIGTYRAAREGRSGRSVMTAIVGGVAAVVACACFAVAIILALLWRTA